jgi:hypothetical protein
MQDVITDS